MKTVRRDFLLAMARAGKLVCVHSYAYDDMSGREDDHPGKPVKVSSESIEGFLAIPQHEFQSCTGRAWTNGDGTVHLSVHQNRGYDFRLVDGATIAPANKGPTKARRPENVRMQQFLASHGIAANVKYFGKGSVRGWRLYNSELQWTAELIAQLTALGFRHYDGEPLDRFDGNGGVFSVFVCGHEELLQEVQS